MNQVQQYIHSGWDKYYEEQKGNRAWNGVPDGFLLEYFDDILVKGAQSVIDIAAGDGRNSEPFLNRGLSVVSTDLSPSALKTFGTRCANDAVQQPILIAGDFISLDFAINQFDVAVCFNSIPHFESPSTCIEKISTLLKPGGRAAFNAFTPNDVAYGQGDQISENKFLYRDTLFTFMTEDRIKELLPDCVKIIHSETRQWEEPDHGSYRSGTHIHEACFFIIEKQNIPS